MRKAPLHFQKYLNFSIFFTLKISTFFTSKGVGACASPPPPPQYVRDIDEVTQVSTAPTYLARLQAAVKCLLVSVTRRF